MITSAPIQDDYEFFNKGSLIAIGCYTNLGFELCELTNDVSVHPNGMVGMAYLRSKYTPEYYLKPIAEKHVIKPSKIPLSSSKRLNTFLGHPALEGVWPLATEKPNGHV